MEVVTRRELVARLQQLGLFLLWALCALPRGSSAQQQAKRVPDSVWADQALVSGLNPTVLSNDGNATFQANIKVSGCPAGTLALVFPKATPAGSDISIPGVMGSQCQTVVFQATAADNLQGMKPGAYKVRLQLGALQRPVAFAVSSGGNAPIITPQRTNTTLVTVVKAPTAGFLRQSSAASRTHATITVSVGLDGPAQLPASLALRVWDPTAVEVEPPVATWQPGESDTRDFALRLTRAAPSEQASAWVELVRLGNVQLADPSGSGPPRLELDTPRPAFYVAANQAVYRSGTDGVGSGSGSSGSNFSSSSSGNRSSRGSGSSLAGRGGVGVALSTLGGASGGIGSVAVEVRRAGASPFGSTLQYRASVLQATGCSTAACAGAVFGSGLLRVPPDASSASATVYINWTALPAEAALAVGLQLTSIDNADVAAASDRNATSLYVYGTPYGTCPAGTMGPWQERAAPALTLSASVTRAPQQAAGAASSPPPGGQGASSPGSSGSGSESRPLSKNPCNDTALLGAVVDYSPSAEMLPVLSACAGGDVVLFLPSAADPSSNAATRLPPPPPSAVDLPAPAPQPSPAPSGGGGSSSSNGDASAPLVELQVPFGQDATAVLIPLGSADETVVALNTTCSPEPQLAQAAGGAAAWAELTLPRLVPQPCYVLLQVYGTVWTGQQGRQQEQQKQDAGNDTAADGKSPPASSPPPPSSTVEGPGVPVPSAAVPGATAASPVNGNATAGADLSNGPSTSPVPGPSPSPAVGRGRLLAGESGSGLPILSVVSLRAFNVTLRPRSDPDTFSAGALSLYLLHRPTGRCLPLCGLPQPMLQAAAAAAFGDGFDGSSQAQLDAAATALTLAIRGGLDAVAQLQAAPGTGGGGGGGGSRRLLRVGESMRRWLAAWLPAGWLGAAARHDGAAAGADPAAAAARLGRLAAAAASRRAEAGGAVWGLGSSQRRRNVLLQLDIPSPVPVRAPPPVQPPAPGAPPPLPSASPRRQPSPPPSAGQPGAPLGPPPVLPAAPVAPGSPAPAPSYPGVVAGLAAAAAAARPPADSFFDLAGGLDGNATMRVLFNPHFAEWCRVWEPQVVDLSLLLAVAPHDMALQARSQGRPLRVAGGAADKSGGGGGGGEAAVEELLLGPSTRSELRLMQQGSESAAGGRDGGCGAAPPADKRLAVSLVAPDGISTAALELALYVDYAAAAAAAALDCQNSTSNNSTSGNNTNSNITSSIGGGSGNITSSSGSGNGNSTSSNGSGNGNSTGAAAGSSPAGSAVPAAAGPGSPSGGGGGAQPVFMSVSLPPPPASLWSACRPCGPGSFSNTPNSTWCSPCSPGSASNGTYNKECGACAPGNFANLAGSAACRPCYAGSHAPRPGSTACAVCPDGTTSLADGAAECVVPRAPLRGDPVVVVSFQVLLNMSAAGNDSVAQAASASGLDADAPADSVLQRLIAADMAAALRISPTQVRVSLMELSPATYLVNISATMPLGQTPASPASSLPGPGGSGAPRSGGGSPSPALSPEVDADTLISRLVDNPDGSFPRTREAAGGSLQVQLVQRQVVGLDDRSGGVNPHVVVWPTLAGTALLAVVLGFACRRHCRRRRTGQGRGGLGLSLPPITDALDRLRAWKYSTSPPATAFFAYGRFTSLELQEQEQALPASMAGVSATARQRGRAGGSKAANLDNLNLHLPALGMSLAADSSDMMTMSISTSTTGSGSGMGGMGSGSGRSGSSSTAADLDAVAMMYPRDALAAPRI